ncbi:GNAT family N-acetyltransferase [Heyndrickxia oleronia]|uniref:GNAT family N-acetyltransferase n=1 Tax=Heyndrickxia oleronia TaxID=38875 RepID=A0A8E2LD98_9BACI|nr:GNAT family N-acetyltransferase [Heyndrickxia oleronia]MEC1375230.1 GNAT family N-acetyltransferase [Heyndrickxia oleronia]OOP66034.1 GNAT family N-acetyltransferase [Heyndrickxia oleronia]QQZ03004.1 GNAT family N-acetyltransferase [Heyndrickxia oleronia]
MQLNFETERLNIQPFKKEDAYKIKELANDEVLSNILGLPYPYKLEHAQEWILTQTDVIAAGSEYPLKIVHKQWNEIIGTVTLRIDKKNNKGELGYWIGTDYWGNGFATECVSNFGFNELNLNKIYASVLSKNKASKKVLEKSGLQKEGTLKQNRFLLNKYEDVDLYGLLKVEYITENP